MNFGKNPFRFDKKTLFRNALPDVLENVPSFGSPPRSATEKLAAPADALPLLDRLLPEAVRTELREKASTLPPGEYRARVVVGTVEDATRHPHDYILIREEGLTSFLFVDPEHNMGKQKRQPNSPVFREGLIRPKVVRLMGMRFSDDEIVPELFTLHYRANAVESQSQLKLSAQLADAKLLLNEGSLPEFLRTRLQEVTFWLDMRPESLRIQGRGASEDQLKTALRGIEGGSATIDGKLDKHEVLARHFITLLDGDRFGSLEEKRAA